MKDDQVTLRCHDEPRLLADIGATNAHFTIESAPGQFGSSVVLSCDDHMGIIEIIRAYLDGIAPIRPVHAAIAIANPVEGDTVRMTNRDWRFSIEGVRSRLGFDTLLVVNDFTALAMSLPYLQPGQRLQVGGGETVSNGVLGLIGPGTGLGVSGLIPGKDQWTTLGSEGGHVSMAPANESEIEILRHAWRKWHHASAERLISRPGIELIYETLAGHRKNMPAALNLEEIILRAQAGDRLSNQTLDCAFAMLGTVAANLAITLGSTGGIYIGGGIIPRMADRFATSPFRTRFEAKGRMSGYLSRIPTFVITTPDPSYIGISTILDSHLKQALDQQPLLKGIQRTHSRLSPAERKVSTLLLENPRNFLYNPIAEIARQSGVSQPTVIRFCRSNGFKGLSDFKLKLATELPSSIPVHHGQASSGSPAQTPTVELPHNIENAILQLRDHVIAPSKVAQAIELILQSSRITLHGRKHDIAAVMYMQQKLLESGILVSIIPENGFSLLMAATLRDGDLIMVISSSGEDVELNKDIEETLMAGAKIIAITQKQTALALKSTMTLETALESIVVNNATVDCQISRMLLIDAIARGIGERSGCGQ